MSVSTIPTDVLITYALGSCLGIAVHDPAAQIGGLLHVMLPSGTPHPERVKANPLMFVDTGVPLLFQEMYRLGARKERLVVKVAGGAAPSGVAEDLFQIGKNNFQMLNKLFRKNGVSIEAHDIGGVRSRTMWLEIATGRVMLKTDGAEVVL